MSKISEQSKWVKSEPNEWVKQLSKISEQNKWRK